MFFIRGRVETINDLRNNLTGWHDLADDMDTNGFERVSAMALGSRPMRMGCVVRDISTV